MKRILSIILIICLLPVMVFAVEPEIYVASDISYSINQVSYHDCFVEDLDYMQSVCESLGISTMRTYSGENYYPLFLSYSDDFADFRVYYAPISATFDFHLNRVTAISSTTWQLSLTYYDEYNREAYCVTYRTDNGSTSTYKELITGTHWNNGIYRGYYHNVICDNVSVSSTDQDLFHAPIETINGGLVSLQSGNALVIDTLGGNISQIGLFTTLPVKSSVFSAFRSGASYFATNDLNSIKSIDFNTHAFTWDKQEGTTGILGQTDKGVYTINNPAGGRYLVIVNPRYMPRGSDNFLTNNPITVAISGTYRNLFRYSLSQSNATLVTLADDGESLIETEEGGTNTFGGSVSFDDIPYTDPLPSTTPVVDWGTGNTPDYSDVPTLDNSVIGTATENLKGIRTEFNGFFATIRDCISWLPPQIVSLLVGAMSLMVGIGIVKALL